MAIGKNASSLFEGMNAIKSESTKNTVTEKASKPKEEKTKVEPIKEKEVKVEEKKLIIPTNKGGITINEQVVKGFRCNRAFDKELKNLIQVLKANKIKINGETVNEGNFILTAVEDKMKEMYANIEGLEDIVKSM